MFWRRGARKESSRRGARVQKKDASGRDTQKANAAAAKKNGAKGKAAEKREGKDRKTSEGSGKGNDRQVASEKNQKNSIQGATKAVESKAKGKGASEKVGVKGAPSKAGKAQSRESQGGGIGKEFDEVVGNLISKGGYYVKNGVTGARDLGVYIPIARSVKSRDVSVKITSTHLQVTIKGKVTVVDGKLSHTIVASDSFWEIGSDHGRRCIRVTLTKQSSEDKFDKLLVPTDSSKSE